MASVRARPLSLSLDDLKILVAIFLLGRWVKIDAVSGLTISPKRSECLGDELRLFDLHEAPQPLGLGMSVSPIAAQVDIDADLSVKKLRKGAIAKVEDTALAH